MKPKIFIVLPVFNRLRFTEKCLNSIYSQTYKNYQLILVDDGSTDDTENYVKKYFPKTKIIKGNGNWWWTRCMYEGVKYSLRFAKQNDFILEMNNDLFFEKNYFQSLIDCSKKYKNSLIGSICVRAQNHNEVVESGIHIDWAIGLVYGVAQTISNQLSYYKKFDVIKNLDALPGKGTLVPIGVFKKGVNFKYKLLPHYISDYEFAINAKNHGYKLIVCNKAVAKHYWEETGISSQSNNERISYLRALKLLFARRSMNNIVDWFRFVSVACPPEYKLRNYYFSFLKIGKAILSVFPFYYLVPLLPLLAKIYHTTLLLSYRAKLKIKQFPEYHFRKK